MNTADYLKMLAALPGVKLDFVVDVAHAVENVVEVVEEIVEDIADVVEEIVDQIEEAAGVEDKEEAEAAPEAPAEDEPKTDEAA